MEEKDKEFLKGLSYEDAAKQLQDILDRLRNDEISIDNLEKEVNKAAIISKYCSDKLRNTELKVKEIVDKLNL